MCDVSASKSNVLKLTNSACNVTPAMYPCLIKFLEITGLVFWVDKHKHARTHAHTLGKALRSSS